MSVSLEDGDLFLLWEVVMPVKVFEDMSYATHNTTLEEFLSVKNLPSKVLLAIGRTAGMILCLDIVW